MKVKENERLRDVPGGPDLIISLTQAVADLSLLYAGSPDERAEASLQRYAATILPDLVEAVGPRVAVLMICNFTRTVMVQKHQIEAAGVFRA